MITDKPVKVILHKKNGRIDYNTGLDLIYAQGNINNAPIYAPFDGFARCTVSDASGGNQVIYRNGSYELWFFHVQPLYCDDHPVKAGEVIGKVGKVGQNVATPHIHFRVIKNGVRINPLSELWICEYLGRPDLFMKNYANQQPASYQQQQPQQQRQQNNRQSGNDLSLEKLFGLGPLDTIDKFFLVLGGALIAWSLIDNM